MPKTMKKMTLVLLLLLNLSVQAQALDPVKAFKDGVAKMTDFDQLFKVADEAYKSKRYDNYETIMQRLVELRPFNPDFKFSLAKAYALQDDKTSAYNELILLQKAGLSYPVGELTDFDNIRGTSVFDYIEDLMVKNGLPYGIGEIAFEVSEHYSGMLFENISYDKKQDRFLLGSVRSGSIYQYNQKTGFQEFIKAADPATGPWGVIDLVVDQSNDTLWVSSATLPHYNGTSQANFGRAMMSKYKLSTGELVNNLMMQDPDQPMLYSSLHLTSGQNLYFINAFSNDVFKISKDSEQVEPVMSLPMLSSIKAITTNEKETILYISDFELGIYIVNLATKQLAPLAKPGAGFVAGISDLFYLDGDLIAIQSGISPARLMRYSLKDDLLLTNKLPLESAHSAFAGLGNGVLVDDKVYYVANSQWEKVDQMGQLISGQSWEPLTIIKTPTDYRMAEFIKQQKHMEEIKRKRGLK